MIIAGVEFVAVCSCIHSFLLLFASLRFNLFVEWKVSICARLACNFRTEFYELMIDDVKGTEQFSIPTYRFYEGRARKGDREKLCVPIAVTGCNLVRTRELCGYFEIL